jgi:hypothetical protein
MDELDRILSEEQAVSPPSGFAQRVMAVVMQEASAPPPIPFPWRHTLATLAAMIAVLIALWLFWPIVSSSPLVRRSADLQRSIARIDPALLAWCSSLGAAVIGLLRYSVRFVTSDR